MDKFKKFMKEPSVFKGNLFFLGIILSSLAAPNILVFILRDIINIGKYVKDPAKLQTILLSSNQILILGGMVLIYFLFTREKFKNVMKFKMIKFMDIVRIFIITLVTRPLVMVLGAILQRFIKESPITEVMNAMSEIPFLIMMLAIAILPSFFEEFVMRGVIGYNYRKKTLFFAALMNGILFGIFHMNFEQLLFPILLGFLCVYLMFYTQSIIAPMLLHFFNNGFSVVLMYLTKGIITDEATSITGTEDVKLAMEVSGGNIVFIILAIGFVTLFVFLTYLVLNGIKNNNEERWLYSNDYKVNRVANDGSYIEGIALDEPYEKKSLSRILIDYSPLLIVLVIYIINIYPQIQF